MRHLYSQHAESPLSRLSAKHAIVVTELTVNDLSRTTQNLMTTASPKMSISFQDRAKLPDEVLLSGLQDESVLLNLENERYYGLEEVGTRMLAVLTSSPSIEAAYETLLSEYEVDPQRLREDLAELVEKLVKEGLVEITRE